MKIKTEYNIKIVIIKIITYVTKTGFKTWDNKPKILIFSLAKE
jgi:hypothetical protein